MGVLRTINDRLADAVYCDELRVLHGRDYYNEEIMGLKFRVSAFSFFQTNVEAAENLYTYAINLIDDFKGKRSLISSAEPELFLRCWHGTHRKWLEWR